MPSDVPLKTEPLENDIAAMAFIESSILFQGLDAIRLAELYKAGCVAVYAAEKAIFLEGDRDDALYLIIDGSVSVQKQLGSGHVELAALDRQAVFGEMSVLAKRPRSASVTTRTEARLIVLPGEVIRTVAEIVPKFGRKLAGLMAGRSRDTEKKLGV
jgi:CRP-like cAMP-binding protein